MRLVRRFVIVGLVTLLSASCAGLNDPADSTATMVGQLDGESWRGEARAWLGPGDTLWIGGYRNEEYISMHVVIDGPGTYTLAPGAAKLTQTLGGDVSIAEYATTANDTGTLHITVYQGLRGRVMGEFAFDATTASTHGSYGASATIKNGYFRATVDWYLDD